MQYFFQSLDPGALFGGKHGGSVLAVLAAMKAKYTNMVDPLITQEQPGALLRELAEGNLASEGLESFLTATTPEGFEIVPIPQRNEADIPVWRECLWLPWGVEDG